ncbi:MAG: GGDEF domain-containing protein [Gammaproteobacteria bacterium]|nr:GGDEF domain-containing protein [Gammaproteobacteria bacterium]
MGRLPENLQPRLNPFTLHFRDAAMENDFQATYPRGMREVAQLGLCLAIFLFAVFGFVDASADPLVNRQQWLLRLLTVGFLGVVLTISGTDFFRRHMQDVMALVTVILTASLAVVASLQPMLLDSQYVGFIAIMLGTYTVLALQFSYVMAVMLLTLFLVGYLVVFCHLGDIWQHSHMLIYLSTTLFLVTVGSYTADKQRRFSYYIRCVLEEEREQSRRDALHDPLTGLANRRLLMETLDKSLRRDRRSGRYTVLMFLDLDGFKSVNDVYGHDVGDELLIGVAHRLQAAVREVDTIARLGGDEFIVLFEDVASRADVPLLANRLLEQFRKPLPAAGRLVSVAASIGVAVHPGDGSAPEQLLQAADRAMYAAKRRGGAGFVDQDNVA